MKSSRKLGISSSLFISLLGHDYPEQALETVSQAGISAVEYFSVVGSGRLFDDMHLQRFADNVNSCGISVLSIHAPFDNTDISFVDDTLRATSLDNITRAFDVAAFFGAKTVVIHGSGEPVEDDERALRLDLARQSLNELLKRAESYDIRLVVETLPRSCLGNRVAELLSLLDSLDGEIGVCFDVNHVALYEDVKTSLLTIGDRLRTVHISDCDGINEKHWIPGMGVTDWKSYVEGLDEIGYQGPLIHEAVNRELDLTQNVQAIADAARKHLNWAG